jgi:hypothetical protein
VHRLDRLARLHVQEVALAHAWRIGDHISVFEAAEGGEVKRDDPADPHRRFLRQVMGAAAELERGLVTARLQGGRRRKAAQGGYIGGTRLHRRYGYDLVDGQYVPREEEQAAIRKIASLRASGAPWAAVADALNADAYAPPSGAKWYPMTARRIGLREGGLTDERASSKYPLVVEKPSRALRSSAFTSSSVMGCMMALLAQHAAGAAFVTRRDHLVRQIGRVLLFRTCRSWNVSACRAALPTALEPITAPNAWLRFTVLTVAPVAFVGIIGFLAAHVKSHRGFAWTVVGAVALVYLGPVMQRWSIAYSDLRRVVAGEYEPGVARVAVSLGALTLGVALALWRPASYVAVQSVILLSFLTLLLAIRRILIAWRQEISQLQPGTPERLSLEWDWSALGSLFAFYAGFFGIGIGLLALGPFGTPVSAAQWSRATAAVTSPRRRFPLNG